MKVLQTDYGELVNNWSQACKSYKQIIINTQIMCEPIFTF